MCVQFLQTKYKHDVIFFTCIKKIMYEPKNDIQIMIKGCIFAQTFSVCYQNRMIFVFPWKSKCMYV